jgi:hypothetical protein
MSRIGPARSSRAFNDGFITIHPFEHEVSDDAQIGDANRSVALHVRSIQHERPAGKVEVDLGHDRDDAGGRGDTNRNHIALTQIRNNSGKSEVLRRSSHV